MDQQYCVDMTLDYCTFYLDTQPSQKQQDESFSLQAMPVDRVSLTLKFGFCRWAWLLVEAYTFW